MFHASGGADRRTDRKADRQTDGRTDRHDEANSRFRNFTKMPEKQVFEGEFAEPSGVDFHLLKNT